MVQPFIGEIRMFGGSFAPVGWALCDGQILNVSENEALFSLLGSIYGGNGRTTFGLPDLRGRVPIHQGSGLGLSTRAIGSGPGAETVTLNASNLPAHRHALMVSANTSNVGTPVDGQHVLGTPQSPNPEIYTEENAEVALDPAAIGASTGGSSLTLNNTGPFVVVNFIIALTGVFPSQT